MDHVEPPDVDARDVATAADFARTELPPGAVGVVQSADGILLRPRTNGRDGRMLAEADILNDRDRLVNLDPFRNVLTLGSAEVALIGQTELRVEQPISEHAARIVLRRGRLVVARADDRKPIEVAFHNQSVVVTPSVEGPVGLELRGKRWMGEMKRCKGKRPTPGWWIGSPRRTPPSVTWRSRP